MKYPFIVCVVKLNRKIIGHKHIDSALALFLREGSSERVIKKSQI